MGLITKTTWLSTATVEERKAFASSGGRAISKNREFMSEIGKKGGASVSRNKEHMKKLARIGGLASAKKRREASEAKKTSVPR